MLSLGLYPKGPYLSLEKEKENFCVVFTYSIKRAREIRYFHIVVVQWWQRIVQKKCCTHAKLLFCQSKPIIFFDSHCHSCPHCHCLSSLLLWSKNFATMVMWCHTSPLFWQTIHLHLAPFLSESRNHGLFMFPMYIQLHLLCSDCVFLPQGYVVMFLRKITLLYIYTKLKNIIIIFFFSLF